MNTILNEDVLEIIHQDINWDLLKDSKVLVTGASGMLGSYIVRTLVKLREEKGMEDGCICACQKSRQTP